LKKNLTTPAGQTEAPQHDADAYVNAINQVFAIFRRNYHNQYYKALPNEQELSVTKRLWLDSLQRFSPDTILIAAKNVIESSEFLPTLRTMIRHCEAQFHADLPNAHQAYIEACRAPSPKANYAWTHPVIYYAGKACDWLFLQSNSEDKAYPIFKKEYEALCQQVMQGVEMPPPAPTALPDNSSTRLDKETNLEKMKSLRDTLDL